MQFFGKIALSFLGLSLAIFGWAVLLKFAFDTSLIQTPLPLLAAVTGLSGILFLLLGLSAEVQGADLLRGARPAALQDQAHRASAALPQPSAARRW